jgi:hypothetical protein
MSRWTTYTPNFDKLAKLNNISIGAALELTARHIMGGLGTNTYEINSAIALAGEIAWHNSGRPSYRVSTQLAETLAETRLDIDAAHLRFPHAAFALEFPPGFDIRDNKGRRLNGLLVSAVRETRVPTEEQQELVDAGWAADKAVNIKAEAPDGVGYWRLNVAQDWEGDHHEVNMMLTMCAGTTVADVMANALTPRGDLPRGYTDLTEALPGHDGNITSDHVLRRILSLALGAALFAVSANSRFTRRVVSRSRRRPRPNRPPEPRRWSLGADIQLPRGRTVSAPGDPLTESEEGQGLTFSHIRQGHLRLTPCGPGDDRRYNLRYIFPTRVRPDLPLPPQATRHRINR